MQREESEELTFDIRTGDSQRPRRKTQNLGLTLVQQVRLLSELQAPHTGVSVLVPAAPLPIWLPAHEPGKAMAYGPSA